MMVTTEQVRKNKAKSRTERSASPGANKGIVKIIKRVRNK